MPQVASETNAQLINHSYRPARPGSPPGHTPTSAFETMLDESAHAAADRTRSSFVSDKASIERPTSRPPAESEPSKTASADDAGHTEREAAQAKSHEGTPDNAKSADGKAGDTDKGEIADPLASAESNVEAPAEVVLADESTPADATGKTDAEGEIEDAQAGTETTEAAGKPPKPDTDIIDDGESTDDSEPNDGNTVATASTEPKTAPAVAPTPTAAAHSENATHAADAAEGRTPPAAADAQAKGEEKKAATPDLPPQAKAEDAHVRSEQRPALPEHVELPAQSNRNALADHTSMSLPNNAHAAAKAAADATQPLAITGALHQQPAQSPTATAAVPPQMAAQAAAVPLSGVAIEIASRALAGRNCFDIRLDPPELGRIEVRLDVDRDGCVTSHLVVDRKDTLSLLQRDAAGLQRALQDAGLKTADDGLQFSLRDQANGQHQERTDRGDAAQLVVDDELLPTPETIAGTRFNGRDGGVDIRV